MIPMCPTDMTDKHIEVFQNLHLKSRLSATSVRASILAQVQAPWHHDREREEDIRDHAVDAEDAIVLARDAFDDVDESGLVLWQEGRATRSPTSCPETSVNWASPSTTPSCVTSWPGSRNLRPVSAALRLSCPRPISSWTTGSTRNLLPR